MAKQWQHFLVRKMLLFQSADGAYLNVKVNINWNRNSTRIVRTEEG